MSIQTTSPQAPQFELRHRLDLALEVADLKPEDIAAEIGRSATTIRNYLAGRTHPSRAVLIAWSFKCGVSLDWLETGEHGDRGPGTQGFANSRCTVHPLPSAA